jgi:hypothetical protein
MICESKIFKWKSYQNAMKKGLIITIFIILLAGTAIAQSDDIYSHLKGLMKEILENVLEINEKTCGEESIVLQQQRHTSSESYIFNMDSPSNNDTINKEHFLLVFPEREGELVSIDDIRIYGNFDRYANAGDTCEISINNVLCLTYVKTTPHTEEEYIYETLPQSCVDVLDFDELNEMKMACPILKPNVGAHLGVIKIFYDATWKSC